MGRLQSQATAAGVAPERLVFGPPCSPKLEHLKRVTLAGLALDTLIYNGHTTASDMLWTGVPLITMRGDSWPSLVATSITVAAEMPELVVKNLKEYENMAVTLATRPEMLKELRDKLAQKRKTSPLFKPKDWISDFELGLDEVWRRHVEQECNHGDAVDVVVKKIKPVRLRMCLSDKKDESLVAPSSARSTRRGAQNLGGSGGTGGQKFKGVQEYGSYVGDSSRNAQ